MLTTYEQRSRLKLATTVIAVLVIAGIVLLADHLKAEKSTGSPVAQTNPSSSASTSTPSAPAPADTSTNTPANTSTGTDSTSATGSPAPVSNTSGYKDGTYKATSSYYVPHGREDIQVSLTLQNGIVTASSIRNSENDFDSAGYQEDFAAEYKQYVVGRKIDGLRLSYIAGASDTTQGFNDAVSRIASQARA